MRSALRVATDRLRKFCAASDDASEDCLADAAEPDVLEPDDCAANSLLPRIVADVPFSWRPRAAFSGPLLRVAKRRTAVSDVPPVDRRRIAAALAELLLPAVL